MPDGWRKIDRGLFESADGHWRIANPWKLNTELRHRWLVAQRRSDGARWNMLDGDHATLQDARAYVEGLDAFSPVAAAGVDAGPVPRHARGAR